MAWSAASWFSLLVIHRAANERTFRHWQDCLNRLAGVVQADAGEFVDFEERWTGAYIFENEWQSFRTRQSRELELTSVPFTYPKAGRYTIAVKVIDIFGNDTMTLAQVTVG